ncbi:hypothetical protein LTR37_020411 [Vermiconidia calcicola]|uniref:Uncharacterized protein n=1 Tax=Vermiconidia calcicola TaxID=1690605 RepID=A0ACC3MBJ0_9PEZI|nr:hypothetical protein LTR37_020411 [Vermiconidia calcicola]
MYLTLGPGRKRTISWLTNRASQFSDSETVQHEDQTSRPNIGPLQLPSINPFVRIFNKDKTPNEPDWDDAEYKSVLAMFQNEEQHNKEMMEDDELDMNFEEDTHIGKMHLPGRHVDDEIKRVAKIYVFRLSSSKNRHIKSILENYLDMRSRQAIRRSSHSKKAQP